MSPTSSGPRLEQTACALARVGVDVSEQTVDTTATSGALREQSPVWLHRGEHFFSDMGAFSCAGAPLWGPYGQRVGMTDLTGVRAPERVVSADRVAQQMLPQLQDARPKRWHLRDLFATLWSELFAQPATASISQRERWESAAPQSAGACAAGAQPLPCRVDSKKTARATGADSSPLPDPLPIAAASAA